MRNLFLLLAIVSFFSLNSCKKAAEDLIGCSPLWALEVVDEATAMSEASTAYGQDPSPANCLAYKAACQDYIDVMEPFANCSSFTAAEREEIQSGIDDTQADLDALTCQ